MGIYGADMMAFLRARAAKKRAKTDLKEADAIYQKAKANLEELRDNFNAAFESSAEKENWTADKWIAVTTGKSIWSLSMIVFHYKSAVCRRQTGMGAEKRPEHGSDRPLNMRYSSITTTQTILLTTYPHI